MPRGAEVPGPGSSPAAGELMDELEPRRKRTLVADGGTTGSSAGWIDELEPRRNLLVPRP
jgi:hypothetical protein